MEGIRTASPGEYGQYTYPDYGHQGGIWGLIKHLQKTGGDYYRTLRADMQTNGPGVHILVRTHNPAGRKLPKPTVMDGHHRAAVAYELGLPLQVGDYDNQEHYNAAMNASRPWFAEHSELKAQGETPWRKEAAPLEKTGRGDYGMGHLPDTGGPPLHDLLEGDMMPRDFYDRMHEYNLYSHDTGLQGEDAYKSMAKIRKFRGQPDKKVRIWRGAPAMNPESRNAKRGEINHGDWVGLSREKAIVESRQVNDPPGGSLSGDHPERYHIWSALVPARHVRNQDGDICEWAYSGPDLKDLPHFSERCDHRPRVQPVQHPYKEAAVAKEASGPEDYGIRHRPLRDGAPAHDLHEGYAEDIYTHPQYWAANWPDKASKEGLDQLRRVRGKPDEMVDIYRATHHSAPHEINEGDWVSLSRKYAEQHAYAESVDDEPERQYVVHHARVPAHTVRDAGTDQYREQGYWGPLVSCCGHQKTAEIHDEDIWHELMGAPKPEHEGTGETAPEGEVNWARPQGESPVAQHVQHGLETGRENPWAEAPYHGPYHVIRHPETRAIYLVDAQGRNTSMKGKDYGVPERDGYWGEHRAYEHLRDFESNGPDAHKIADDDNDHKLFQLMRDRRPGFEHSRVDPEDIERVGRRPAPVAAPEGISDREDYHGPYGTVRHPETNRFHVVDNAGRATGIPYNGFETQLQAERSRDYIDQRQQSKAVGKAMADSMYSGLMEVMDPGGTDESRQAERNTARGQELMTRYAGGKGKIKFEDEDEGNGGRPYYERDHYLPNGKPSGWYTRHYGGTQLDIYHRATGDDAHAHLYLPETHDPKEHAVPRLHKDFDDVALGKVLDDFHANNEARRYYEEHPNGIQNEPRIQRWKQRHLGSAGPDLLDHFGEDDGPKADGGHTAALDRVECSECHGQVENGRCRSCGQEMAVLNLPGARKDKAYPVIHGIEAQDADPGRSAEDDRFLHEHGIEAAVKPPWEDESILEHPRADQVPRDQWTSMSRLRKGQIFAHDSRDGMVPDLAARGHDMAWKHGEGWGKSGHHQFWQGDCRNCGGNVTVGSGGSSCNTLGRCARDEDCTGPGTTWQNDLLIEHRRAKMSKALGTYFQSLKDVRDRQWLHEQSLGSDDEGGLSDDDRRWLHGHGITGVKKQAADFWDKRMPEIRKRRPYPSERMLALMHNAGGPHEDGFAYIGEGGFWCPGCKRARERHGKDTSGMQPLSWSELRGHASPTMGESCSDCMDELVEPREHTASECDNPDGCPHALADLREAAKGIRGGPDERDVHAEYEDERLRRAEHGEEEDASVPPHISEEDAPETGGHEDWNAVLTTHHEWSRQLKQREKDELVSRHEINKMFSSPEHDEAKRFLETNPGGSTHMSALEVTALHARDEMPPDPGTAPIPEGHIRLWHYTRLRNVDSIRERGLDRSFARGDAANGDLTDPSAGMWASTKRPDDILNYHSHDSAVVEFHAHPSEISGNAESPWQAWRKGDKWDNDAVQEWARGYHHVIMRDGVPPSDIVAIHEPHHGAARYMRDDDPSLESYKWVREHPADDDAYGPYVRGLQALDKAGHHPKEAAVALPEPHAEAECPDCGSRDWRRAAPTAHDEGKPWAVCNHCSGMFDASRAGHDVRFERDMDALDRSSKGLPARGPYYHGTTREDLEEVTPQPGAQMFPHDHEGTHGFATANLSAAWNYAEHAHYNTGDRPRVYEVRPKGDDVELDPARDKGGNSRRNNAADVRSLTGFDVEREMPVPERLDHMYGEGWRDEWEDEDEDPGRHEGALQATAALENPYTNRDIWYHGTQAHPEDIAEHGFTDPSEFASGRYQTPESEDDDSNHWNRLLGSHFTADHAIADEFARGEHHSSDNDGYGGEDEEHNGVVHARVQLKNPKFYGSEHEMDHEAYQHEFAAGNHPIKHLHQGPDEEEYGDEFRRDMWPGAMKIHWTYGEGRIPDSDYGHYNGGGLGLPGHPMHTAWLHSHPDKYEIAMRFKQRLMDAGHDGIVYRNEYEKSNRGAAANTSIIAFHPHQIEVTQHHHLDEPHDPDPEPAGHLATLASLEPVPAPVIDLLGHFEATGLPGGQLKLFHMQHQKREPCPECNWHPGETDPEAATYHRKHVSEDYEPDTCEHCGGDKNLPTEHRDEHEDWLREQDWYTDWTAEGPGDTLHRGMSTVLPGHVHSIVHDEGRPMAERAKALTDHLLRVQRQGPRQVSPHSEHTYIPGALGNFWSDSPDVSKSYAETTRATGYATSPHGQTPLMLHIHTPDLEHFETDPDTLEHWGVHSFHKSDNREVPLQNQTPVQIKGISWAPPEHGLTNYRGQQAKGHPEHFGEDPAWRHHEFGGEGIRAIAGYALPSEAELAPAAPPDVLGHFEAAQSRDDYLSQFFTPIPPEELEAQRRAHEPQPERLDDREYSIKDVSRHYDWEGFDSHEIGHLVHRPEHAVFTHEDVPVESLRYAGEDGQLKPVHSYQDIAGQDDDEKERLAELERGYNEGANIPPIVVVRHGEHHIVIDGSHRAAIHAAQGSSHIPAFVTERTRFPKQAGITTIGPCAETPVKHKPASTTGGAMTTGTDSDPVAAITAAFAGTDPIPALQAEAVLQELPDIYRLAANLLGLAGQKISQGPLGPAVGQHLADLGAATAALAEKASEGPALLNGSHSTEMERLHNPRPSEEVTFDLSAQKQGPKT
jgi:hypothetical protein